MAKEKVITSTGIKAEEVKKHNLTAEIIKGKIAGLVDAPSFKKKDELQVGRFLATDDGGFIIYTVEERDLDAEYSKLSEADKRTAWVDGYKRKHVNAPNHRGILEDLGLVEKGSATQKAVDRTLWDIAYNMAKTGISVNDIVRYSGGKVPMEMAEAAINEVASGK
jgi:hypothetical protein